MPYGEDEAAQPPERKGTERNDAYRVYEEIIKDNIEYNILLQDMKFDHDRLNEIVDIMLIVQDQVWNRVTVNRAEKKATRYYMDEFHLLLKEEQTAAYPGAA